MGFIRTFESRIAGTFGADAAGRTAPFSFRKLARRTAKELEAETYVIDGVDTAPALVTILVSPADDAVMRTLYAQLTAEIVDFVEAEAAQRGYVFVGQPLARFIVDDELRAGRFAVFAENVDRATLERLRAEEEAFLSGASIVGGAAAELAPQVATPVPTIEPDAGPGALTGGAASLLDADAPDPFADPLAAGLDIIPSDYLDDAGAAAVAEPSPGTALAPPYEAQPMAARVADLSADLEELAEFGELAPPAAAGRHVAPAAAGAAPPPAHAAPPPATCLLVDHQSGHTYNARGPATVIGRERGHGGIVLRDPNVSRRHAELTHDGSVWRIRDLASTNGTLVNDVDVSQCVLHDGDLLTIGLTNLEFREGV